jgi:Raf kinase inhibitor-like YbhB/YbcL family protein
VKLTSPLLQDNQPMPEEFAFCAFDPQKHATLGGNKNPPLAWGGLPDGTKSLVLICVDPDVPTRPDDVNKDDREVPADLPRTDFYHWVLVDLSTGPSEMIAGEFSDGVTAKGKAGPKGPRGTRQGINNYTDWFAGDPDMGGTYFGYDGACPPWNDSILHNYVFTLYALDLDRCPVSGEFTGPDVLRAIEGHVLAKASLCGTYSLNPRLRT